MSHNKPSLDDLYLMVSSIYSEQNALRPASATFAHFVETCGMLSVIDRKKRRDDVTVVDALCKSLGWFFPLLAKFRIISVEELVYRKYPYACPYCRELPHKDVLCKTTRGAETTVNHIALREKYSQNKGRRPSGLNGWQQMFDDIYPRDVNAIGSGRSALGLLEEIGELAEAVRVFDRYPKYFAGEAADVFSYIMGVANEYRIKQQMDGGEVFDFEVEFLMRYPGLCLQCGHEVCICPSVPESTVGRLAKELDLTSTSELFSSDMADGLRRGRETASSLLESLGGLPAIADRLPFDRGEANRALLLLCLKIASEIQPRDAHLAENLRQAAVEAATDIRTAGSRDHGKAYQNVMSVLASVWPVLNLAAIPNDSSMPARLGKLLRAQSCRIGIVTALPKEFAAMRAMLDEESPHPVAGDPNNYVVGTIQASDGHGSHVVVVTMLKEMGNNSAAAAATHLLRSFPSITDVMMVGIAGGVPSYDRADKHVRLGDVVVSNGQGIVQYDNLKISTDKVELRSSSDKPSARIIGAINHLESERLMKKYPWEDALQRGQSLECGTRPAESTDQLFKWEGSVSTLVPHPVDAERRDGKPKIHYGLIGAANTLLKDPAVRDKLGKDCNVRAVEMEGSGIADAAWNSGQHYVAIRGVCDYCDPNKNDAWQMYAAVAAAAYARTLITQLPIEPAKTQ